MDTNTAPAAAKEAKELSLKEIELSGGRSRASQTCYTAQTDEERALDKRLNLKLDFTVVAILAVQFIVGCRSDHCGEMCVRSIDG